MHTFWDQQRASLKDPQGLQQVEAEGAWEEEEEKELSNTK